MKADRQRIVLAGGSGFIGSALATAWLKRNAEVIVLTRAPKPRVDGATEVEWDGKNLGEWIKYLERADAVINLAGKSINCPHTPETIRELTASRVDSVKVIASAIYHVAQPPRTWVQASAIGYYGNPGDRLCDETAPAGDDTLALICRQWESALAAAVTPKTRKIVQRIGFVLGRQGGALPVLEKLTRWFLGGQAGNGRQFISWIHVDDLVPMFIDAVGQEALAGVFNAVGPAPVTNKELMKELRHALHRPWSPPAPAWAIRVGARLMRAEPSLALAGCRADARRWREAGYPFRFDAVSAALRDLYP